MYRKHIKYIENWFQRSSRKPLIIRGARQVGKTTAVKLAAEALDVELITLNMEDPHSFVSELYKNDPETIFELIALSQGKVSLDPKRRYSSLMKPKSTLRLFLSCATAMKKHHSIG